MRQVDAIRLRYGSVYCTIGNHDVVVPWKPLSIGRWLQVKKDLDRQLVVSEIIENEVFKECVVDPYLVSNIDSLDAGLVEAVSVAIFLASGPKSLQDVNEQLEMKRMELSGVLHTLIDMINKAFPAIPMSDIYDMDYQTLMMRSAQAEKMLIHKGILAEPIFFSDVKLGQKEEKAPQVEGKKKNVEQFKQQYFEQQRIEGEKKPFRVSELERQAHALELKRDEEKDMKEKWTPEAPGAGAVGEIYPDYLDQMRSGKPVKIKSLDERVKETEEKLELARKKYATIEKKRVKEKEENAARYDQIMAEQLEQKARKKRR